MKYVLAGIIMFCTLFSVCLMTEAVFAGTHELRLFAYGKVTEYGPLGCELTDEGCTISDEGTVRGTHIGKGKFVQTTTVLWKAGYPNGSDGSCAPARGVITITAADKSSMTMDRVGTMCRLGNNVTFNATYSITGGTKRFANAAGIGISTCSADGSGNVLGFANGSLIR